MFAQEIRITTKVESESEADTLLLRLRNGTDCNSNDTGIDSDSEEIFTNSFGGDYCVGVQHYSLSGEAQMAKLQQQSDSALSSERPSLVSSVVSNRDGSCPSVASAAWSDSKNNGESKSPDGRESYRRASSLKTSRNNDAPSSQQKKAVRFADALGLDLTAVKQLMDTEFLNPPSWCQTRSDVITRKVLRPTFQPPLARHDSVLFRRQVLEKKALLETLLVNELTIIGSVRVANIAFQKRVFVRYTTDCWAHVADKEATYVALSCDGQTDLFSFTITAPADIHDYGLAEFCVCFVANGTEYWDNNSGRNYVCEVLIEEIGAPYGSDLGD